MVSGRKNKGGYQKGLHKGLHKVLHKELHKELHKGLHKGLLSEVARSARSARMQEVFQEVLNGVEWRMQEVCQEGATWTGVPTTACQEALNGVEWRMQPRRVKRRHLECRMRCRLKGARLRKGGGE